MNDTTEWGHLSVRLDKKLEYLSAAIAREAHKLGLVFVNGPDPAPVHDDFALKPALDTINGQLRGGFLFAVAEEAP